MTNFEANNFPTLILDADKWNFRFENKIAFSLLLVFFGDCVQKYSIKSEINSLRLFCWATKPILVYYFYQLAGFFRSVPASRVCATPKSTSIKSLAGMQQKHFLKTKNNLLQLFFNPQKFSSCFQSNRKPNFETFVEKSFNMELWQFTTPAFVAPNLDSDWKICCT